MSKSKSIAPPDAQSALKRALEAEARAKTAAMQAQSTDDAEAREQARLAAARKTARELARVLHQRAPVPVVELAKPVEAPSPLDVPWLPTRRSTWVTPQSVLTRTLPQASLLRLGPITAQETFIGVWTAHRARAGIDARYDIVATADRLLSAIRTRPSDALYAASVRIQGTDWAVFIDIADDCLLAALKPAALYLDGIL